ncbi:ATP-binding protein [Eubacterium sp. 1001713B170207_170306_E7]|uniref:ATP-binding protein n=1 Tax=Eubacterium sp. 1001713B170207_170306_E7 TaxID=2787097 RepID=UPI001898520E|nr:ATP-binding protein [Eubacterium sp. 1001713B170207_170306_E7]
MKKVVLPAETDRLYQALDFVTETAREYGGVKEPEKLELIVEEVFVNIASYAYKELQGDVRIECGAEKDLLIVRFRDCGEPYDPLQRPAPDITCPVAERPIGGLGIYLVKEIADRINYAHVDGENILTIGMNLQGGAE